MTARAGRFIALAAACSLLAGCETGRFSFGNWGGSRQSADVPAAPAAPTGRVTSAPLSGAGAPATDMIGRWTLATPGAGSCAMNFGGAPGAPEGTIAPEGGCPGRFFTSRRWAFEHDALIIRNHKGEPLAHLASVDASHFNGQATSGETVTLAR